VLKARLVHGLSAASPPDILSLKRHNKGLNYKNFNNIIHAGKMLAFKNPGRGRSPHGLSNLACMPSLSSLLLPTSDVRPSTSAPRATSWYGDTAEGEEEVKSGGPARTASLHHHE